MSKSLGLTWVPIARGNVLRRDIQIDWVYCRRNANMNQLSPLWLIRCPNLAQMPTSSPSSHFAAEISTLFEFLHICSIHYRQLSIRSPTPSSPQNPSSLFVSQFIQHTDTYYHDQESNGHNNEQCESKPAQYHCRRTNSAADAAVAEILSNGAGSHRSCVLP